MSRIPPSGVGPSRGQLFAPFAKRSGAPSRAPLEDQLYLPSWDVLAFPLFFDLVHELPDFVERVAHLNRRLLLEYHLFAVG